MGFLSKLLVHAMFSFKTTPFVLFLFSACKLEEIRCITNQLVAFFCVSMRSFENMLLASMYGISVRTSCIQIIFFFHLNFIFVVFLIYLFRHGVHQRSIKQSYQRSTVTVCVFMRKFAMTRIVTRWETKRWKEKRSILILYIIV